VDQPPCVSVGIDGCRAGWLAIALLTDASWDWRLAESVEELVEHWSEARCLIDMPIGLPLRTPREVESIARRLLGRPRASSVFPVPSRAAVYAADYQSACEQNRQAIGSAISRQAWNLSAKIRQVDGLLRRRPALSERLLEAHPELCFYALAGGKAMAHGKKTAAGASERRAVLSRHLTQTNVVADAVIGATRRGDVARDDVLDALALAVSGRLPLARIPPWPPERVCDRSAGAQSGGASMVFPQV
jgi:predicted RNase H-like nuclease